MKKEIVMLTNIERVVFFPIVRLVAFISAFVLLLSIVSVFVFVLTFDGTEMDKINISFSELQTYQQIGPYKSEEEAKKQTEETKEQIKIPNNLKPEKLKEYADNYPEDNSMDAEQWKLSKERAFDSWNERINSLSKDQLKDLSKIVAEAKKKNKEYVSFYIYAYFGEYDKKLREKFGGIYIPLGLGNQFDQAISRILTGFNQRLNQYFASVIKGVAVFALLLLLTLFAIIIVLLLILSIEKNTRKGT
jgi:hypothetical protein